MGLPVTVEGSKCSNMTCPQCPQMKSSPPVPDILRSVRRIERFKVVTGPIGIMGMVAIRSPKPYVCIRPFETAFLESGSLSNPISSHATLLPRVTLLQTGTPEWSLVMLVDLTFKDASQARSRRVFIVSNVRYSVIQ